MLPRVNLIRTNETDYLLFSTRDAISTTVYAKGHWAKPLTDISLMFCSDVAAPLVLDIGANLGAYAIPLAQRLLPAGGTVFAFEPQRIIYYQLCGNVFLNRLDNVHTFQTAIGDMDGTISIPNIDYEISPNIGGFSVDATASRGNCVAEAGGCYDVRITRIDSLTLPKPPSLIKIDVEGAELDVLRGARKTIAEAGYPPLMLESWTDEAYAAQRGMLLEHLQDMGYASLPIGDEILAQHPAHPRQFAFGVNAAGTLQMTRIK